MRSSLEFTLLALSQRFRSSVEPSEIMPMKVDTLDLIYWSIEKCDEPKDLCARPWNTGPVPKMECSR